MSKYEVTEQEKADAPKITLAGKTFPIPMLAPRQSRKLVPFAFKMGSYLNNTSGLEETDFDEMIGMIAVGLSRTRPDKTVPELTEELMDMPITLDEMQAALQTIFEQTGVVKRVAAGDQSGEAAAGSSQTGTAS